MWEYAASIRPSRELPHVPGSCLHRRAGFGFPRRRGGTGPGQADEQTLKEGKIAADEQSLLKFFRERTLTDAQRDRIAALIAKTGDDSFDVREEATAELMKLGGPAIGPLRQAADPRSPNVEVARRAGHCLELLKAPGVGTVHAAARTLARHKPAGAAAVLLAFLPFGEDESTQEAIRSLHHTGGP